MLNFLTSLFSPTPVSAPVEGVSSETVFHPAAEGPVLLKAADEAAVHPAYKGLVVVASPELADSCLTYSEKEWARWGVLEGDEPSCSALEQDLLIQCSAAVKLAVDRREPVVAAVRHYRHGKFGTRYMSVLVEPVQGGVYLSTVLRH